MVKEEPMLLPKEVTLPQGGKQVLTISADKFHVANG